MAKSDDLGVVRCSRSAQQREGKSYAARKVVAAGGRWRSVRWDLSLLYKVTWKLLTVPSVPLRHGTAKDAELLVIGAA